MSTREEKVKKILKEIGIENQIKEDYFLEYGIMTKFLSYRDRPIIAFGGYEMNRNGHKCLSYYRLEDYTEEEFNDKVIDMLISIKKIDADLDRKMIQVLDLARKEKERQDELCQRREKVKQIVATTQFKYDGAAQMMIVGGTLYVADPDLTFSNKIDINECSEIMLEKIENFLNGTWVPSEATLKKWRDLNKAILKYYLDK